MNQDQPVVPRAPWSRTTGDPVSNDIDRMAAFVLRVRRIEEHSLVQDRERLKRYAAGTFNVTFSIDGTATIQRDLPPEEYFESLTARLRPLVLKGDAIQYGRVLNALTTTVQNCSDTEDSRRFIREEISTLRSRWRRLDIEAPATTQAFELRVFDHAHEPIAAAVTDTQLAAAWLYADLVHADPKPNLTPALVYPLKERYIAAVGVFSRIALLSLSTRDVILHAADRFGFHFPAEILSEPVTVNDLTLVDKDIEFYEVPEGVMASDALAAVKPNSGWRRLTLETMLADQDPTRLGIVRLWKGREATEWDAVTLQRDSNQERALASFMVAGALLFTVTIKLAHDGSNTGPPIVQMDDHSSTNSMLLRSRQFLRQAGEADAFSWHPTANGDGPAVGYWSLTGSNRDNEDAILDLLSDLVQVEAALGPLPMFKGEVGTRERIQLRWLLLTLQGKVVAGPRTIGPVTADSDTLPESFRIPERQITIGNITINSPPMQLWHPYAELAAQVPWRRTYRASIPEGQRYLLWNPARVQTNPRPGTFITFWGLSGTSERTAEI